MEAGSQRESTTARSETRQAILVDAARLQALQREMERLLTLLADGDDETSFAYTIRHADGVERRTGSLTTLLDDLQTEPAPVTGLMIQARVRRPRRYGARAELSVDLGQLSEGGDSTARVVVSGPDPIWVRAVRGALRERLGEFLLPYSERSLAQQIDALLGLGLGAGAVLVLFHFWARLPTDPLGVAVIVLLGLMVLGGAYALACVGVFKLCLRLTHPMVNFAIGEGARRYEAATGRRRALTTWVVVLGIALAAVVGVEAVVR